MGNCTERDKTRRIIFACFLELIGKKTPDPKDFMAPDASATNGATAVAQNIWNLFLGGSSPYRPFGNVVLDGIDLHLWNNGLDGVVTLANTLRQFMGSNYILTASARCMYPDYILNPTNFPLTTYPPTFDYITSFFIQSSNVCGYKGNNPQSFWTTLQSWSTYSNTSTPPTPLVLGLADWPVEPWDQASTGDYIPPWSFATDNVVPRIRSIVPQFGGFALQDASFDYNNRPCVNDPASRKRAYSDVLYTQLVLPASMSGNNTGNGYICLQSLPVTVTTTTTAYGNVGGKSSTTAVVAATGTTTVSTGAMITATVSAVNSSNHGCSGAACSTPKPVTSQSSGGLKTSAQSELLFSFWQISGVCLGFYFMMV
ncbi:hypothetical protein HDU76_012901 [Blyttiomyces sp. JEL0837]|nr:hypothetical protein HDU76_012901 [Blyttiomyces sp. JEL0837]